MESWRGAGGRVSLDPGRCRSGIFTCVALPKIARVRQRLANEARPAFAFCRLALETYCLVKG
jgi:hypothetical protein